MFNYSSFLRNSYGYGSSGLGSSMYGLAAEYMRVRSSSYRKVLKTYYNLQNNSDSSNSSSAVDKLANNAAGNYSNVKTSANNLYSSAKELYTTGTESLFNKTDTEVVNSETGEKTTVSDYDKDSIISAVKGFVSDYNSVVSAVNKANNFSITAKENSMLSQTNTYADKLSEIGITIGTDSKLSVDEEKLSTADFDSVKELFNGVSSFAYKTAQNAFYVSQAAVSAAAFTGNTYSYSWFA